MSTNWKWRLVNDGVFDEYVTPIFQEKVLERYLESDQVFLRPKWNNRMSFYRADYDLIFNSDFGVKFNLILEQLVEGVYIEKENFYFTRIDCKVSETPTNKYIEVLPEIEDIYKDILDNYDSEINVVDGNTDSQAIDYYQKPIIQVYLNGASKISNFIDKTYFEQAVSAPTSDEDLLINEYKFEKIIESVYIPGFETPSGTYTRRETIYSDDDELAVLFAANTGATKGIYIYKSNLKLRTPGSTLDDSDFGSTWLLDGKIVTFIYRSGSSLYFFSPNNIFSLSDFPPFSGTITHVANAVHTSSINYNNIVREYKIRMAIHEPAKYNLGFQGPTDWLFLGGMGLDDQGTTYVTENNNLFQFDYYDIRSSPGFMSSVLYTQVVGGSGQVKAFDIRAYSRLITNLTKVNNTETVLLPSNDLIGEVTNYTRVSPIAVNMIIIDTNVGADQGWGMVPSEATNAAGNYWVRPSSPASAASESLPVIQSLWVDYAVWMYFDDALYDTQTGVKQLVTIEQAFSLKSIIGVLLGNFAPDVTFNESTLHSKFYYQIDNSIRGKYRKLFFTPKTNVSFQGTKSARLGDLSFSRLFAFLYHTHKVKWYLTDLKELVLEHSEFFRNGLSYNAPIIGTDVTGITNTRTQKSWDYDTKVYDYRKSDIPSKLKYSWMDDVSVFFTGKDFVIKSEYSQKDLNPDENLSPFTSDLNFVLANANEINKDGFMALETCIENGRDVVAEYMTIVNGDDVKIQNGYLSFVYLHEAYHLYDAPAKDLNVNSVDVEAISIKRNKIQDNVRYPDTITDYMGLCKTSLGVGKIIESKENLDTLNTDIKIEHDTE